ncbi:MAG: hypothetical protein ACI85I_002150, partial [Arenicella sp.]
MKLFRISVALLMVATLFTFNSCDEVDELTKFDLDYKSSFTVSASPILLNGIIIATPDITTNAETRFENNKTRKDLVESIKLKSLVLDIETPSGEDFSFLKSVKLSISADGLPDKQIASKSDISGSETTLELIIDNVELKDYLLKDSFSIK